MSKMSMLYDELMGQCARLGFQDLGEAEQAGYGVDWQNARLIKVEDEQEKAHEAWLEEKRKILNELNSILNAINGQAYNNFSDYELLTFIKNNKQIIAKAIEFIEKGEV